MITWGMLTREFVDNMYQLEDFRELVGNPQDKDVILQFCLDNARDIICDIRNSNRVEDKYKTSQIAIAIEIYNKRGAEGQTAHNESGLNRTYEKGDISSSVISRITPMVKTPSGKVRDVN